MGVSLEVTPELKSSGMIRLELHPKVVDLIGYDSYQITPDNTVVWPMAGASWTGARAGGLYPVFSRTADGALNSVGKLYNNILDATTPGDQNDVNGWASNAANSPNYGYVDRNRMFDKEELLPVPTVRGELPYFRVREIETAVTVADGSTVGMGGLIYDKNETFTDKVPVLGSIPLIGRLFRSEGERSIKRNLMIFVTATQVDVNGRRVADLNVAN
ncbi:MAG: hypothetical protein ISR84_04580 [Kiritimatiellales bacterium]|nr:hypothetical protein [Kiritimatiellales bacterium]